MQKMETLQICRLCLVKTQKFMEISDDTKRKVEFISSTGKIEICDCCTWFLCITCLQELDFCCNFKEVVIQTEDKIINFNRHTEQVGHLKLINGNSHTQRDIDICRICLLPCNMGTSSIYLYSRICEDLFNMDLSLSKEPKLCTNCEASLVRVDIFNKVVLKTQQTIENFGKEMKIDKITSDILKSVIGNYSNGTTSHFDCNSVDQVDEITVSPEDQIELKNNIMSETGRIITYKCVHCPLTTEDLQTFIHHLEETHAKNIPKKFYCFRCTYTTTNQHNLEKHERIHKSDVRCHHCKIFFDNFSTFKLHKMKYHPESCSSSKNLYQCYDCEYFTGSKLRFAVHRIEHGDTEGRQKLKCPDCTYTTYIEYYLQTHTLKHKNPVNETVVIVGEETNKKHGNDGDAYHCLYCTMRFATNNAMQVHKLRNHPEKCRRGTIYECKQCPYITTDKKAFVDHRITHGDVDGLPKLNCDMCDYHTYRKYDLEKHMWIRHCKVAIHKAIKPREGITVKCALCDFSSKYTKSLKEHMRMHKTKIRHSCPYCDKSFHFLKDLEVHYLADHPEKCKRKGTIYQCADCTYNCVNKTDLAEHRIVHGDVANRAKLFCAHCAYTSYRKPDLEKHILSRHSMKFTCSNCNETFRTYATLNEHKKWCSSSNNVCEFE